MSRGPDAATLLERALLADAAGAGCAVTTLASDWTRWSSATFTGARHELSFAATHDARLEAWLAALPEADLAVRGHVVADLAVVRVARSGPSARMAIEALTVESA